MAALDQPSGTRGRFEAIYAEHVTSIHRFIYARVGNRPDAEDLTGQVFMRAVEQLDVTVRPPDCRLAYRVAQNAVADYWRSSTGFHGRDQHSRRLGAVALYPAIACRRRRDRALRRTAPPSSYCRSNMRSCSICASCTAFRKPNGGTLGSARPTPRCSSTAPCGVPH